MNSKKQIKNDIKNLTPTLLNKKYPKVYNSWRAMKQRRNTHGAIIHKDFEEFASFLLIMGDKPSDAHTLDRIDYNDPEYSPQKVRWATKKQQSNNKSDNVLLTNVEGITHTLAEWAFKTNQNPNTLRRRRARGWNDTEIISGTRDKGVALTFQPFPYESQDEWENEWLDYALAGGEFPRIEFLYKKLEGKILKETTKFEIVSAMLDSNYPELAVFEHIENAPSVVQDILYKYRDYLASLNVKKLRKEKRKLKKYLKKTHPTFKEVQGQIQYDLKYKEAFENRPATLTKGQFRDYYAKRNPRPRYTVNLPPDFTSLE